MKIMCSSMEAFHMLHFFLFMWVAWQWSRIPAWVTVSLSTLPCIYSCLQDRQQEVEGIMSRRSLFQWKCKGSQSS